MPQLTLVKPEAQKIKMTEEYYDTIRTNIQLSGRDLKVFVLTAAQAGEGKGVAAIGLAVSFARSGYRTLLIDADARYSASSKVFQSIEPYQGLTSVLSGTAELSDVICDTDIANLMIIPAGESSLNPTALLQSEYFQRMIETIRGLYDYVIIDTTPIETIMDATIIANIADASMLVTKSGVDDRRTLVKLKEQLEKSHSVFLGAILNDYNIRLDKKGLYGNYKKGTAKKSKNSHSRRTK